MAHHSLRNGPSGIDAIDPFDLVGKHYGIAVSQARPLGGEVDRNVFIEAVDGRRYLLKITQEDATDSISWQEDLLEYVAERAPDIPIPHLVAASGGARLLRVSAADSIAVVRLLSWLEGTMLAEIVTPPLELLRELGGISGLLTRALEGFPTAGMSRTHHWDVRVSRRSVDECATYVTDPVDLASMSRIMEMFDSAQTVLEGLPMAVVHQDLNDFNVLAARRPDGSWGISGILDFGDALFTHRVADVAVTAAYSMLRQPDAVAAMSAVVAGFDEVCPLSAAERSVIFPLAAARLCVNAATWTRRTTESNQPYGAERMRFTWPTIRAIADLDEAVVLARINAACSDFQVRPARSSGEE